MKKKIIALIVILAMVLSLAACNKKEKPTSNSSETEQSLENESGLDSNSSSETSGNGNYSFFEEAEDESTFTEDPEMSKAFAEFVDEQYKTSIESSFLTMHMFYKDPEAAGFNLDNVVVEFGKAPNPEENAEDLAYYKELKATLESFDRSKLTAIQRDEYDSLEWEIGSVIKMVDPKFDYYSQLFSPPNSLDQNILSFLTSYELRSEREVKDVVTLIDSIPKYVDSSIEYAKVQQENNLLLTDFDALIKGCEDIINTGMDSFALRTLQEKVDELDEISAENKENYKKQIQEAFERSFLPSIQKIIDAMNEMKGGNNNTEGYAAFPNGAEYFEVLLNYNMGLIDASATEIKKFMEERNESHMNSFLDYMTSNPEALATVFSEETETTGYTDYHEILEYVKSKMYQDHPEVKHLEYNVEPADPEEKLDEKNVVAYFVIPALDGDHTQQMRINPSSKEVNTLDSYETITHEGFPGHMYQHAYIYDNIESDYIKTLSVDGNVEGYAVYAQYGALDYLDNVQDASKVVTALNSKVAYLVHSIADIGINYEEMKSYYTEAGYELTDEDSLELYNFLRCAPSTYEAYSCGYELIAMLRERAEEKLGDKFNALEFNTALLNAGPTPYTVVQRHINEYIENTK